MLIQHFRFFLCYFAVVQVSPVVRHKSKTSCIPFRPQLLFVNLRERSFFVELYSWIVHFFLPRAVVDAVVNRVVGYCWYSSLCGSSSRSWIIANVTRRFYHLQVGFVPPSTFSVATIYFTAGFTPSKRLTFQPLPTPVNSAVGFLRKYFRCSLQVRARQCAT